MAAEQDKLDAEVRALRDEMAQMRDEQAKIKEILEDVLFVHAPEMHCPSCLQTKNRYVRGELVRKVVFKRTVGELYRCPECGFEFARTVHRSGG